MGDPNHDPNHDHNHDPNHDPNYDHNHDPNHDPNYDPNYDPGHNTDLSLIQGGLSRGVSRCHPYSTKRWHTVSSSQHIESIEQHGLLSTLLCSSEGINTLPAGVGAITAASLTRVVSSVVTPGCVAPSSSTGGACTPEWINAMPAVGEPVVFFFSVFLQLFFICFFLIYISESCFQGPPHRACVF